MDKEMISRLADSAAARATDIHKAYDKARTLEEYWFKTDNVKKWKKSRGEAAGLLNDFFYWTGKVTAYKGVVVLMEREEKERV
jgi:hypothetical protein